MIIQQHNAYKRKIDDYVALDTKFKGSISYLSIFLFFRFYSILRYGIVQFFQQYPMGMMFEEIDLSVDNQENLVYLSESWSDYDRKVKTTEIEQLIEDQNYIALCKMGFLEHAVMSKDNFIHILFAWEKLLQELPPFALLYQDEQGWFDVKPFATQQAMEQFVVDHQK